MSRRSPLLGAAALFAGGIAAALPGALPVLNPPPLLLASALALLLLAHRCSRGPGTARAAALAAFGVAGLAAGAPMRVPQPGLGGDRALRADLERQPTRRLTGRVRDTSWKQDGRLRVIVDLEELDGRALAPGGPRGVRLSVAGEAGLERVRRLLPGDRVQTTARLRWPRAFGNPGAFDYRGFLARQDIVLLGSVKTPLLVTQVRAGPPHPARALARLRGGLRDRLAAALREDADGPRTALLGAMLLGERAGLEPADRAAFADSGLIHLLSISGLHVGLLTWAGLTGLRRCGAPPRAACVVILLSLPLYAILTGLRAPVVRAATMAGALLIARLLGRRQDARNALGIAALTGLAARPAMVRDIGWQLSFAATAAILLFARPIAAHLPLPRFLRTPVAVSVAAALGVAPLLAATAHRVAPGGLVANIVAVPLTGVALLAGIAGIALESVRPGAGSLAGMVAAAAIDLVLVIARPVAAASWATPGPTPMMAGIYYAVLLTCLAPRPAWLGRLAAALVPAALAAALIGPPSPPASGTFRMDLLDVSQGDSILLRAPDGTAILVDAGGFSGTSFDVGATVVAPALWSLGVRRLAVAIGTHGHHDHLGGLPAVIERLPTGEVWLPDGATGRDVEALHAAAARRGTRVLRMQAGDSRRFGALEVDVLHPQAGAVPADANEGSLVLRVRLGRRCALLPGDAGDATEALLLRDPSLARCDVLKVGHHGSASATSAAFLDRLRPRLALIPVGAGNPWDHPHAKVLHRLAARDIRALRTDCHGAIGVETDGRWLIWSVQQSPPQSDKRCGDEADRKDDPSQQRDAAAPGR